MTTYNQLEKEFNKKVAQLRAKCKHKNKTKWMEEWWAPGHSTGRMVKLCKTCGFRFSVEEHK